MKCRFLLSAALLVPQLTSASRPALHQPRLHPNPSIAILGMTQGPDGVLWLAAEDGLYCFDGFRFTKIPGYPFPSARFVAFTEDGSLWAGSRDGLVRRLRGTFETIWRGEVVGMFAWPRHVLFSATQLVHHVALDGAVTRLRMPGPLPELIPDRDSNLWFPCQRRAEACWAQAPPPGVWGKNGPIEPSGIFNQLAVDSNGRRWLAEDGFARSADGASQFTRRPSRRISRHGPLIAGRNGQIWFAGEIARGLVPPIELRRDVGGHSYLPTTGHEDRQGRFWMANLGEGLLEWSIDPSWLRWSTADFGGAPVRQLVRTSDRLIAVTPENLFGLDPETFAWKPLGIVRRNYVAAAPIRDGGLLAAIRAEGLMRLSERGEFVSSVRTPPEVFKSHRHVVLDGQGQHWIASGEALLSAHLGPGAPVAAVVPLPSIRRTPAPAEPADVEMDRSGRLWVGYAEGVAWRDKDRIWRQLHADRPIEPVRSLALGGDRSGSEVWVVFRRPGVFARLLRQDGSWRMTEFTVEAGHVPRVTYFIRRDSRGWIWRGSAEGVHISDGRHLDPADWIHIGAHNGLSCGALSQYGFYEDGNGSVWLAGDDGVTTVKPDSRWFAAPAEVPPPAITRIDETRFWAGTLDASPFRPYPLRYRLLPLDREWKVSADGDLRLGELAKGKYALEVGFTGSGPSLTASHGFEISAAGFWPLTWVWFALPLASLPALPWLARRCARVERIAYRLSKCWFLLRRRVMASGAASTSAPSLAPELSGTLFLGRYHLGPAIARSAGSVVYSARDLEQPVERVAVKVLTTAVALNSAARDRFAREVATLQSVRHRGVVPILDSWIGPAGEPCLAMPLLEGPTLRSAMQESGTFPPARAARLTRALGEALAFLHGRGVVHRDLKPENIMLTEGDQPVLIDFGAAALRGPENELAATSLLAGSFYYLAPERLAGQYSPATDVYALGIILLEMLTARRLADLQVMFSEPGFVAALSDSFDAGYPRGEAQRIALALLPTFDPNPRNRPGAGKWAGAVADVLESTAR